MLFFYLLGMTFFCVYFGILLYRSLAIHFGIVANPNFRSLHQAPIPTGGGLIFVGFFIGGVSIASQIELFNNDLLCALIIGGIFSVLIGFIDDVIGISPLKKLFAQLVLSGFVIFYLRGAGILCIPYLPDWLNIFVFWLGLLWLINLYNFIDGIDGLAAGGGLFLCIASIAIVLLAKNKSIEVLVLMSLLATCLGSFLIFNLPKASIFMGDSGSIFLGFFFGAMIVYTAKFEIITLWTWLILFGYFAGDTTTTTIIRMLSIKKWYGAHRSNAYQNLARISNSHAKVLFGVMAYKFIWLFPIALLSSINADYGFYYFLLAYLPVIFMTYKFGPRFSSS